MLSPQGEVKLLSYLPAAVKSFAANSDGGVVAVLDAAYSPSVAIDLSQRPKAACLWDVLGRPYGSSVFVAGEVVRLYGGGFGPPSPATATTDANQTYPTSFDGLSVEVGGVAAPILSAAPGEVVFVIPSATPASKAIPVIVRDHSQLSVPSTTQVQQAWPWQAGRTLNADGTPNSLANPAGEGSVVTIFLTGAGPYSPPLVDGQVAPLDTSHSLQLPVSAYFGTYPGVPATILYAGSAPGQLGLAQINIQLPTGQYGSLNLTIGAWGVPIFIWMN